MRAREYLYVRTTEPVAAEAEYLRKLYDLEPIPDGADEPDEIGLRGPARTADATVGYEIQPNTYVVFEPEPQEVQAIDGYPVEIAVWLGRDEGTQRQEARLVFEDHVRTRPDVPVLLCHDVSALIAAYLPEKGVYDFPPGTTIDAAHQDRWRDWALA
ncbi:hypothetical protein FB561_5618 [Kribbella amoyensis]|uniref:Uncharacterized protein n=1 Tax=Kribbella amoyensis TaxID=996641 RepID=A0A561BZY5_9ACTN|nr:hypothetical protein [Kribbella amoyensis]TWD84431.1 hypothetical protein FB561_5618 [Kribbella amoyensis]